MSIIDNFVNDFVNQDKIFPDALLVEDAAVVSEDLHHAIDDVEDSGGGHVGLTCCHEVYAKLLGEKIVHSVHILNKNQLVNSYVELMNVGLKCLSRPKQNKLRHV